MGIYFHLSCQYVKVVFLIFWEILLFRLDGRSKVRTIIFTVFRSYTPRRNIGNELLRKKYCKEETYPWKALSILIYVFDWLCFIRYLTCFSTIGSLSHSDPWLWLLQSCVLDLFISFVLQWLSLNWEVTGILLSQFPLTFLSNSKGAFPFHHTAFGYSLTDWDGPKAGEKLHLSPWFSAACGVAIAHRSQSLLSFLPTA